MTRTLIVPEGAALGRLDVFLACELGVSRSLVQHWLKAGCIVVNATPQRARYQVQPGDVIAVDDAEPEPRVTTHHPLDLPVVYEDADLIVIDKPAGLAVHPGNGRAGEPTVADWARDRTADPDPDRPGIVHRLDQDTSGLLVIAKSASSKQRLQQLWQQRQVHKTYQLLAVGRVEPLEAVIKLPLDRDPAYPTRRRVMPGGKPAVTRYRTIAQYPRFSHIEAYPETGRTHQLRVHFAALGHPIAGDIVYGPPQRPLGLQRQFLHASGLTFTTPSGHSLTLTSSLPPDLKTVLSQLQEPYN